MRTRGLGLLLGILLLLNACAVLPTGPNVMVWPGAGKPFAQFQLDEGDCRSFAQHQLGMAPDQAATQSAITSTALGTVLGAAAGAAIGAAAGNPGVGAAVGAGSGLFLGSVNGVQAGATSVAALQARYDVAYTQCMYAKGHQVPGVAAGPAPTYGPPFPPPPPPNALPPPPPPARYVPPPLPPPGLPAPPPPGPPRS
jgi:Glycine-zipper domain